MGSGYSERLSISSKHVKSGADRGFYKGGCPIHLKGAPEVEHRRLNIFPAFLALEEVVGARRSYDI